MILAAAVLLVAATVFDISHHTRRTSAIITQISLDGTIVKTLDLSKDTKIAATSPNSDTNHLIVKDDEV